MLGLETHDLRDRRFSARSVAYSVLLCAVLLGYCAWMWCHAG